MGDVFDDLVGHLIESSEADYKRRAAWAQGIGFLVALAGVFVAFMTWWPGFALLVIGFGLMLLPLSWRVFGDD